MKVSRETEKMDSITFTKTSLKKGVKYFLNLGNKIIRGTIRICIGSDVHHTLQTTFYMIKKINGLRR